MSEKIMDLIMWPVAVFDRLPKGILRLASLPLILALICVNLGVFLIPLLFATIYGLCYEDR